MFSPSMTFGTLFSTNPEKAHITVFIIWDGKTSLATLTSFEGNVGKKVVSRDFKLEDSRIVGYGHPDYPLVA